MATQPKDSYRRATRGGLHLTGIGSGNIPDLLMVAVNQLRTSGISKEDIPSGVATAELHSQPFFGGDAPTLPAWCSYR